MEEKYQIIATQKMDHMATEVTKEMKKGWICQGGISVTIANTKPFYFQALIKE